ncbi:MAG: glycosyltransferase family 39 protein [Verrucomicrobiota bacterium]|nr:glycosyltransferase family 39 protein [Verrucomicrobiota bacterium]
MENPDQETYLSCHAIRWSWTLVIICGFLLGYYVLQTYGLPRHRQYQLDFGKAKWIEAAVARAPVAYFRKEIYLTALPAQAWIEVAASDNFGLLVNGHTIGVRNSVKTYEAGIYDIKRALRTGTNVIAVSVSRISYPGPAQLRLRGEILERGGKRTQLLSDESWAVTNKTGIVAGSEEWNAKRTRDETWPKARLSALNDQSVATSQVDMNPLLLELPRIGYWIMADNGPSEAVFSTTIKADRSKQETWIQIASSGDLDLAINGHIISLASSAARGSKKLPHLPSAEETAPPVDKFGRVAKDRTAPANAASAPFQTVNLSAYDVSHWIRRGQNVIVATVRGELMPASLFVDGFVVKGNKVDRFSTNGAWRIGERPNSNQGDAQQRTIQIGPDGIAPWGYLPQETARPLDHSGFATLFQSWAIVGLTLGLVIALWLIVSAVVSQWLGEPLNIAMGRDALLHGPILAGLLLLLLPNYDPRFPVEWSFQPIFVVGAFSALILIRLFHLLVQTWTPEVNRAGLERMKAGAKWETRSSQAKAMISRDLRLPELFEIPFRQLLPYMILILIMFLGLGFRYQGLGYMSFDHDEMGLVARSKGIFNLGFPYTVFAGEVRWATTYEAVPYPLALFGFLFGYSEWSMRLPACLMGTLCIAVIGLFGRRLFDWRVGLFAAFLYACLPLNIRWAQNAFYLSQCQLMAMLTFWFFYEAIQTRPFKQKFLTAGAVTFCLTYLSWEGTGFLLPALFMGLLLVRWGQWWWLKDFHLYRCLFFIGALVVAQYCSRMLAGAAYLQVGSGLSNLTGPSLYFLAPGYQPMFYVDKLLLSENHVFFTLMILAGLTFCWKHSGFRYVVALLATLFVLHTNFLAALSPRYCYYFQPLVILGGVAATVMLYDRVRALARRAGDSLVARFAAHATGMVLLLLLFVQSNESVLKTYQLSSAGDAPQMMARLNTYRYDYRGAAEFVKNHARPGDVILPGIPHVFNYYAGIPGTYFLNTLFSSKVPYNQLLDEPRFADKFGGLPVIRNIAELKDVVNRSGRAWVIFAPYSSFDKLNSPAVLDYIHENSRAEFESYRAKVLLIQGAQPGVALAETTYTAE